MVRFFVFFCICLFQMEAYAEKKRIALIVANADYPESVGELSNTYADATAIAQSLDSAGFDEIIVIEDAGLVEFQAAIISFAQKLKQSGPQSVGFFYFSGHGASSENGGVRSNYIIPVDAEVTSVEALPILGISMRGVIDSFSAAGADSVFVVIDACRNSLPITATKGGASERGFTRVSARSGLFLAYSTSDGETAPDDGKFSKALAKQLSKPMQYAGRAFELAARETALNRRIDRLPYFVSGLQEDFCFVSCPVESASSSDEEDWIKLSSIEGEAGLRAYLFLHPDGKYSEEARRRLSSMDQSSPEEVLSDTTQIDAFDQTGALKSKVLTRLMRLENNLVELSITQHDRLSGDYSFKMLVNEPGTIIVFEVERDDGVDVVFPSGSSLIAGYTPRLFSMDRLFVPDPYKQGFSLTRDTKEGPMALAALHIPQIVEDDVLFSALKTDPTEAAMDFMDRILTSFCGGPDGNACSTAVLIE